MWYFANGCDLWLCEAIPIKPYIQEVKNPNELWNIDIWIIIVLKPKITSMTAICAIMRLCETETHTYMSACSEEQHRKDRTRQEVKPWSEKVNKIFFIRYTHYWTVCASPYIHIALYIFTVKLSKWEIECVSMPRNWNSERVLFSHWKNKNH